MQAGRQASAQVRMFETCMQRLTHVCCSRLHAHLSLVHAAGFLPLERELVFDIDLTDYDDVRTCGKEGHICNKCWPLMAVAVQVGGWTSGLGWDGMKWSVWNRWTSGVGWNEVECVEWIEWVEWERPRWGEFHLSRPLSIIPAQSHPHIHTLVPTRSLADH
jgi:hypothetical protein